MAKQLVFEKDENGHWVASFTSTGETMALEINRTEGGTLQIFGNLEGMEKVLLKNFGPGAFKNQLFEVDVPGNVTITVESYTEVTGANYE